LKRSEQITSILASEDEELGIDRHFQIPVELWERINVLSKTC
jgi:hypothetical protein